MKLRFAEARHAAQKLLLSGWVDPERLYLSGFSEGGSTTALYSGDEFKARIILGWVCHSGNSWWHGIKGPSDTPVLAIVGSDDRYHQSSDKRGTHCGTVFYGRPDSTSIYLEGMPHNITVHQATFDAVEDFIALMNTR